MRELTLFHLPITGGPVRCCRPPDAMMYIGIRQRATTHQGIVGLVILTWPPRYEIIIHICICHMQLLKLVMAAMVREKSLENEKKIQVREKSGNLNFCLGNKEK